ncbi:MAG TPA: Ada metal-binding domain-containing protein, partial [Pirellulaceae bacterium]|nr:Ada metal-binding domain-containing protein [Pirellulaceae bacterium]
MPAYSTDEQRWQAVVARDPAADGRFFYGVLTTGVYCRNVCPARQALRKNVRFFATCAAAEQAGLRPCKRCQPTEPSLSERQAHWVAAACRQIEASATAPPLAQLAAMAGVSSFHFQRVFKAQTGITPKAYAQAIQAKRTRHELAQSQTVTAAFHSAGYQSSGRFYEDAPALLGMEPKRFQAGGTNTTIEFAIGQCWLGAILVAATERGVCMISLGDDPDQLARELQDRFPQAELIGGDVRFEKWVAQVIGGVESPQAGIALPLD